MWKIARPDREAESVERACVTFEVHAKILGIMREMLKAHFGRMSVRDFGDFVGNHTHCSNESNAAERFRAHVFTELVVEFCKERGICTLCFRGEMADAEPEKLKLLGISKCKYCGHEEGHLPPIVSPASV